MPWDSVDKWRDEDYWPEIGSENYMRSHYEERDTEVGGDTLAGAGQSRTRNPGTRQVRVPPAPRLGEVVRRQQPSGVSLVVTRSSRGGAQGACGRARSSLLPFVALALFVLVFTLYALNVHA